MAYLRKNLLHALLDFIKENEIATGNKDTEWISITVDEIHSRTFGNTAVASGFISAQGRGKDGNIFSARVRFLATLVKRDRIWQLDRYAVDLVQANASQLAQQEQVRGCGKSVHFEADPEKSQQN